MKSVILVVGWENRNASIAKMEAIYLGQDSGAAAAAEKAAFDSGKYADGAIKRRVISDGWVPRPCAPFPRPIEVPEPTPEPQQKFKRSK